jgi:hypothetical protein
MDARLCVTTGKGRIGLTRLSERCPGQSNELRPRSLQGKAFHVVLIDMALPASNGHG